KLSGAPPGTVRGSTAAGTPAAVQARSSALRPNSTGPFPWETRGRRLARKGANMRARYRYSPAPGRHKFLLDGWIARSDTPRPTPRRSPRDASGTPDDHEER